jgi:2-aminoethylphosphonate dioxygenase
MVSVDDSTIENGCLELTRGHNEGVIDGYWEPLSKEFVNSVDFEPLPMKAGDVVFFDCFVPHQSQPNLSKVSRRNMYITYNRQSEGDHRRVYFDDKRKSFPPDFERDPNKVYNFQV